MKNALSLALGALLLLSPLAASAGLPDGKVAVVKVTAIDGLARFQGPTVDRRSSTFGFDGTSYRLGSGVRNLDGVQTLVLIDRREDSLSGETLTRTYSQEVRAFDSTYFEVSDLKNRVLAYQVASIGGNLRLTGSGDQIVCPGGENGPYQVWKIESVDLVDKNAIHLN